MEDRLPTDQPKDIGSFYEAELDMPKLHKAVAVRTRSPLNDRIFQRFETLCDRFGVEAPAARILEIAPSARSALGGTAERLLALYGQHAIRQGACCPRRGRLLAFRSGSEFTTALRNLRSGTVENTSEMAAHFYLSEETVAAMVSRKQRASYPDAVAVFEHEICVVQVKLSGETDVNNTAKNVEVLVGQSMMFSHLGKRIECCVAIPCPKHGVEARWIKELGRFGPVVRIGDDGTDRIVAPGTASPQPCHSRVAVGSEVFHALFGTTAQSETDYQQFLDILIHVGSDRLFASVAPPGSTYHRGVWDVPQPACGPCSWVVQLPASIDHAEIAALRELMESLDATVLPQGSATV